MQIRPYTPSDQLAWDLYVRRHSEATHCHLTGWKDVIEETYGHKGFYLLAEENSKIVGILPLIHVRVRFLGGTLCSMPFLNYGGTLSDSPEAAAALLQEAARLASRLGVRTIELRQTSPIPCQDSWLPMPLARRGDKIRMVLPLSGPAETFFASLKSKLKSQIRRPLKEGMTAKVGGAELAEDFYAVFARNMRDLGSPVHSPKLFKQIFRHLDASTLTSDEPANGASPESQDGAAPPPRVHIGVVYHPQGPVAAGLVVSFRRTVEIPWASSLRAYNRFSPNMLLYWSLLEHAINEGHRAFDFGRSTPMEGTYRFKEQWGARPQPLYWYVIGPSTRSGQFLADAGSKVRTWAAAAWSRLPLPVANTIGPWIRGAIPL
jgi:serine/alanine adding enzyme